jgi:hypothetical protein
LFTQVLGPIDDESGTISTEGGAAAAGEGGDSATRAEAEMPPLLQVTFRSSEQNNKLFVVLNKTRLLLPMITWVRQLQDWMLNMPPSMLQLQERIDKGLLESPLARGNEGDLPKHMHIIISVTDPEFVMVEDRFSADANAVVLKFCAVLRYNHTPEELAAWFDHDVAMSAKGLRGIGSSSNLESVFESLEMFTCQLNRQQQTALSIIDPCHLEVNLDRQVPMDPPKVASSRLTLDISGSTNAVHSDSVEKTVCGRFSYRDFVLFTGTVPVFSTGFCTRGCYWIPRMFACSLKANMRVTNGIPRGSPRLSLLPS